MKNNSARVRLGIRAAAVAATAMLALSGCSGGDAGSSSDNKLTVLHASINYEPLYLAKEEGFFDDAGLDVTIKPGGTAQDNLGQLAGGSVDLSVVSWDAAVTATAENVPIQIISSNAEISGKFDTSAVMVRADSGIKTVADLKGKTIAFNSLGTGGNVPVLQALKDAGVDPSTVEQVAIPYATMISSLESSQVDAIFPSDSFYTQAKQNPNFVEIAHPSREYRAGLGITMWAASTSWLEKNGDKAEKFNEAMAKAIDFYKDPANEQKVYEVRAEVTGQSIDEVKSPLIDFDIAIDPEVSQRTTEALQEFGLVEHPKTVDEILWAKAPRK